LVNDELDIQVRLMTSCSSLPRVLL
jgi:hypothetical protein